jgi:hypothetical protein
MLLDATGQIYVATNSTNTIAVFATGAVGNATPARIIQGSNTGLNHPGGITF